MPEGAVRCRVKLNTLAVVALLGLVCLGGRPADAQLSAPTAPNGWTITPAPVAPAARSRAAPLKPTLPLTATAAATQSTADELAATAMQAVQAANALAESKDVAKPVDRLRQVIVIDPGHGGIDPGAVGPVIAGQPPVLEKNVVLAVSKQLAAALLASGRYDVVLTRSGDTFVPLEQRASQSRRLGADLFISIHADSVAANANAQGVRGATVYMLSDEASDEQARRLAEKENAADHVGGMPVSATLDNDQVRNILVDLMRRETAEFSAAFRATVVSELGQRIAMAREPNRAAAFKVLKQTEVPAVLIELGYMSNVQDQKLLQSAAWQSQVAGSIAVAVDRFFTKRVSAAISRPR